MPKASLLHDKLTGCRELQQNLAWVLWNRAAPRLFDLKTEERPAGTIPGVWAFDLPAFLLFSVSVSPCRKLLPLSSG